MTPWPNHPYVHYRTYTDTMDRFIIECVCSYCGDRWQKHCVRPWLWQDTVFKYAVMHGHGLRPMVHPGVAAR